MTISPLVGLKNFYRLNATDDMIDIIADEYARLTHSDAMEMTRLLKEWTHAHDEQVLKRESQEEELVYLLLTLPNFLILVYLRQRFNFRFLGTPWREI